MKIPKVNLHDKNFFTYTVTYFTLIIICYNKYLLFELVNKSIKILCFTFNKTLIKIFIDFAEEKSGFAPCVLVEGRIEI